VDLTVEVGGTGTLTRSLAATRMGGTVSVIGGLTGFGGTPIEPVALLRNYIRLSGFMVGSRVMLEDLLRFMESAQIRPVIDREFAFAEAQLAYEHLEAGRHFGKIVLRGVA
jgi:NADPH:quinone reductase-like Zn-dependent oxidoreductase